LPPVPSLLSDLGTLVRVVSDGGEAKPRGLSLAFDKGDARYDESLAGVTGPTMILLLSLSLSDKAETDDDSEGLLRKVSFCSISLRFVSRAASCEAIISFAAGGITVPSGGAAYGAATWGCAVGAVAGVPNKPPAAGAGAGVEPNNEGAGAAPKRPVEGAGAGVEPNKPGAGAGVDPNPPDILQVRYQRRKQKLFQLATKKKMSQSRRYRFNSYPLISYRRAGLTKSCRRCGTKCGCGSSK